MLFCQSVRELKREIRKLSEKRVGPFRQNLDAKVGKILVYLHNLALQ